MGSLENDEQVLAISRIVDQVADEFLEDDPDWGPLETVLPMEWCDGFMWMYRVEQDEANIELYKHGITRRCLNLDQDNKAYRFTGTDYIQIPVAEAIDWVFAGIEEMGRSRDIAYDQDFVAEKHRQLREAGWTVISTGTPGSGELLRELDEPTDYVSDEL